MSELRDLSDKLRVFRSQNQACLILAQESQEPKHLLAGLASLISPPSELVILRSDRFSPREVEQVLELFRQGATLVVLYEGQSAFPSRLADAWTIFAEAPRSTSIAASDIIFNSQLKIDEPGALVVLHVTPSDTVDFPQRTHFTWLQDNEVERLEQIGQAASQGLGGVADIREIGGDWRSPTATVTIRDLCLLHERDGSRQPRLSVGEILNQKQGSLNWTDLQQLLRAQFGNASLFRPLGDSGHLDKDKLDFALSAFEYLRERSERYRPGIFLQAFPTIYDVVWLLDRADHQHSVFRGQLDSRWKLDSSLLRRKRDGSSLDIGTLLERIAETEAFLAALRDEQETIFGTRLSDDALLAVAQHFGFATPLLDFTTSMRIAAFFATLGANDPNNFRSDHPLIGVIYRLRVSENGDHGEADPGASLELSLLDRLHVRVGETRVIDPGLPHDDDRINRQQGVFIAGYQTHDLNQIIIDRYYFQQEPGVEFSDPLGGIDRNHLLPESTRLSELAAEVPKQSTTTVYQTVNAAIAGTRLAEISIFGSLGVDLSGRLAGTSEFLAELKEYCGQHVDATILEQLREIIDDYFLAARIEADVGISPQGEKPDETRTIATAVQQLAILSGSDDDRLWSYISRKLEGAPLRESLIGQRTAEPPDLATPMHRIALACAVFLASWEHLRYVDGGRSRDLEQEARLLLRGGQTLCARTC